MRQFRDAGRPRKHASISRVGWLSPRHASILGSAGRWQRRSRMAVATTSSRGRWPERDPSMRQFRDRPKHAPEHASIGRGLVGPHAHASIRSGHASVSGAGPSMRQFRDRSARACVNSGVCWLEHASISGSVDPSMRLFRGLLARACVSSGVCWPEHASIPGSVGPEHASISGSLARACVNSGVCWPEHAGPGRSSMAFPLAGSPLCAWRRRRGCWRSPGRGRCDASRGAADGITWPIVGLGGAAPRDRRW